MPLAPAELNSWLEWAGAKLIALPIRRDKPATPHVLWPAYSQDVSEVLDFRGKLPVRTVAPGAEEITVMDLILTLPNVCERQMTRRVLHARSLVHPLNSRHLFSWRKIGLMIHLDRHAARKIHSQGLVEAARKTDPKVCSQLRTYFDLNPN